MTGKLQIAGAVLLWALVLRRAGSLRRPGPGRSMQFALIFLALAAPLQVRPIYHLSNELLRTPEGASILKTALATGVAAGVAGISVGVRSRPGRLRRSWAAAALAVTASTVPLLVWPVRSVPPELAGTTEYFDAGWRSVVHWVPFLALACWAVGSALAVFWAGARRAGPGSLRTSLRLVATACILGCLYLATKAVVLVAWHLPGPNLHFWAAFDQTSELLIITMTCAFGALGAGWENVVDARRAMQKRVVLWQLRPLWRALKQLVPTIELAYGRAGPEFRLRRRVTEIRDGLLAIEDHLDVDLVSAAQAGAEALVAPNPLAPKPLAPKPLVVAAILRYLADPDRPGARGLGPTAVRTGRASLPTAAACSFAEELDWVKQVTRCYRDPRAKTLSTWLAAGAARAA